MPTANWLLPVLEHAHPATPTLVLCASGASVAEVRRQVAAAGGALGLEVATPLGLAARVLANQGAALVATPVVPRDPVLAAQLHERPSLAQQWSELADRIALLGQGHRPELAHLVADGPLGAASSNLLRLCELAESAGKDLGPEHRYVHVYAVGFSLDGGQTPLPGHLTAHPEWRLLNALGAAHLAAPPVHTGRVEIDMLAAADVVAEARASAAMLAEHRRQGGDLARCVVLVTQADDAARIRAACYRADVPANDDEGQPLRSHALTSLLRLVLPWFAEASEPTLSAADLAKLMQHRMLVHGWTEKGIELLDQMATVAPVQGDEPRAEPVAEGKAPLGPWVPGQRLGQAVHACRIGRAPLGRWLAQLQGVANGAEGDYDKRAALVALARVRWLAACRTQAPGNLGQILDFLNGFGVRTLNGKRPDGPAMAILAALNESASLPATWQNLDDALAGAATSGELHRGVAILPYASYDGRPAELLILSGLHAKGLGKTPAPSPFLATEPLATLGILQGEAWLDAMETRLCAAVRRAQRAVAIQAARDATGRSTAPYGFLACATANVPGAEVRFGTAQRALAALGLATLGSYGMEVGGREAGLRAVLRRVDEPVPRELSQQGGAHEADLARQATLEWLRCGAEVADRQPAKLPDGADLAGYLQVILPARPEWAGPWLGQTGDTPAARWPEDKNLSATSGLEPLTHCLYQAFAKQTLRLREDEAAGEEPDAAEVGNALHLALEKLHANPLWRPATQDDVLGAIDGLATALGQLVGERFADIPTGGSAAQRRSNTLQGERWQRQVRRWLAGRVRAVGTAEEAAGKVNNANFDSEIAVAAAAELDAMIPRAKPGWTAKDRAKPLAKALVRSAAATLAGGDPCDPELAAKSIESAVGVNKYLALCDEPVATTAIERLAAKMATELAWTFAELGGVQETGAEWKFGQFRGDKEAEPFVLTLADGTKLTVNGAMDAIRLTGGSDGTNLDIIDFKTWKGGPKRVKDGLARRTLPQVALYTLVAKAAIDRGSFGVGATKDTAIRAGFDFLREPKDAGLCLRRESELDLPGLQALWSQLLERARHGDFALVPHADVCPVVNPPGDYCAFASLCRLRALPATAGVRQPSDDEDQGDAADQDAAEREG